jgi:hypothetical protein
VIRSVRIGCVMAAMFAACPAFGAKPGDVADITYAIVTGYPDNKAIIDKTGLFTRRYLKYANYISKKRVPLIVGFPAILHRRERTCQDRYADIYPDGTGFIVIEQSKFFPAIQAVSGKLACDESSAIDGIRASSIET